MDTLSQRLFYEEVGEGDLKGNSGIPGQDGVSESIEKFEGGYQGRRK